MTNYNKCVFSTNYTKFLKIVGRVSISVQDDLIILVEDFHLKNSIPVYLHTRARAHALPLLFLFLSIYFCVRVCDIQKNREKMS